MIRIALVDDHKIVRAGLKQILDGQPDIAVVVEVGTGKEAIEKVRVVECDVVVLDMALPDIDGLTVLQILKQEHPQVRVLMLSMYPERHYAVRLLRAGAAGYLSKESAAEEFIDAIRHVASGRKYVTATLAEQLAFELDGSRQQFPHESLSDREYQVMVLIAKGISLTIIAEQLSLSIKTVSTYRGRILEKMHLHTNAELIRYALEHGLL